ncbi:hypothetical protein COBT_001825 [Conglomerata obtusa]
MFCLKLQLFLTTKDEHNALRETNEHIIINEQNMSKFKPILFDLWKDNSKHKVKLYSEHFKNNTVNYSVLVQNIKNKIGLFCDVKLNSFDVQLKLNNTLYTEQSEPKPTFAFINQTNKFDDPRFSIENYFFQKHNEDLFIFDKILKFCYLIIKKCIYTKMKEILKDDSFELIEFFDRNIPFVMLCGYTFDVADTSLNTQEVCALNWLVKEIVGYNCNCTLIYPKNIHVKIMSDSILVNYYFENDCSFITLPINYVECCAHFKSYIGNDFFNVSNHKNLNGLLYYLKSKRDSNIDEIIMCHCNLLSYLFTLIQKFYSCATKISNFLEEQLNCNNYTSLELYTFTENDNILLKEFNLFVTESTLARYIDFDQFLEISSFWHPICLDNIEYEQKIFDKQFAFISTLILIKLNINKISHLKNFDKIIHRKIFAESNKKIFKERLYKNLLETKDNITAEILAIFIGEILKTINKYENNYNDFLLQNKKISSSELYKQEIEAAHEIEKYIIIFNKKLNLKAKKTISTFCEEEKLGFNRKFLYRLHEVEKIHIDMHTILRNFSNLQIKTKNFSFNNEKILHEDTMTKNLCQPKTMQKTQYSDSLYNLSAKNEIFQDFPTLFSCFKMCRLYNHQLLQLSEKIVVNFLHDYN